MNSITITDKKSAGQYLHELWQHRELLYFLAWRHVLVRYKQTFFGVLWSILRPLLATMILVLVFHRFIGLQSANMPYPLIVISGLMLWHLFANSVSAGGTSLVADQALVTRTYVPRLVLPLSAMLVNLIETYITFNLILALMVWYGAEPHWQAFFAPIIIALDFLIASGVALLFTSLHARYRDFVYVTPFFLQMGFFLSPVAFLSSHVPANLRSLYYLNPLAGLMDALRWSLFTPAAPFPAAAFTYSLVIGAIVTVTGLLFFLRSERTIADVI